MTGDNSMGGGSRPKTTEYGVSVTLYRNAPHAKGATGCTAFTFWSPEPESEQSAIEFAREWYGEEHIKKIRGVDTRRVPAPEGWSQ